MPGKVRTASPISSVWSGWIPDSLTRSPRASFDFFRSVIVGHRTAHT